MSTKIQNKRETKQIRVSLENHKKLKLEAIVKNLTISKLADFIIKAFFEKEKND